MDRLVSTAKVAMLPSGAIRRHSASMPPSLTVEAVDESKDQRGGSASATSVSMARSVCVSLGLSTSGKHLLRTHLDALAGRSATLGRFAGADHEARPRDEI